jgi:hypothetical protein
VNLRRSGAYTELVATLEALAALGEKRVGTPAGHRAAEWVRGRMVGIGLSDVRFESFHFPRHDVKRSSLLLEVAGTARELPYEVFEGAGPGALAADVVAVGWGDAEQLRGVDLHGRIALVDRNPLYHRSTQYQNVATAGAAAMIYISTAPANLRQVGSVRRAWEGHGPIPALSIGATDGHIVRAALEARQRVTARIDVDVQLSRGVGHNVVGVIPGLEREQIVFGAHFDTWFAGSTDNGGGVAALLALAARRALRSRPRYTLVFVAWDGEEIALYGGYDFLRRHVIRGGAKVLAVIDFETPSAIGAQAYGLARSSQPPLEQAILSVGLNELFALNVPMDMIPELFGGVIPTDIQGLYRHGTPSVATAVDSPYYHTVEDTPDKVDLERLSHTIDGFDQALDRLLREAPERFAPRDPSLWRADVQARFLDDDLRVEVLVRDASARARSGVRVEVVLFHDDFFEVATECATSDDYGRVVVLFREVRGLLQLGSRYLHVTAGERYPLVESIVSLD